eukprot:s2268_g8.t2
MTEERRCSAAEVWNEGEPLRAEHFVSHAWTEDFGNLIQGLTRFAVSLTFRESPALPQDKAAGHARGCSFFIHAFSDSMWSENRNKKMEDLGVYQVLSGKGIKTVLFSTGQDGTALLRAWCSLELFLAKGFGQKVVLNTKLGPMQDQSGPSALTPHIQQFATMLLKSSEDNAMGRAWDAVSILLPLVFLLGDQGVKCMEMLGRENHLSVPCAGYQKIFEGTKMCFEQRQKHLSGALGALVPQPMEQGVVRVKLDFVPQELAELLQKDFEILGFLTFRIVAARLTERGIEPVNHGPWNPWIGDGSPMASRDSGPVFILALLVTLAFSLRHRMADLLGVVLPEIEMERAPCNKDSEKSTLMKYLEDNGGQLQIKKLRNVISEVVCSLIANLNG